MRPRTLVAGAKPPTIGVTHAPGDRRCRVCLKWFRPQGDRTWCPECKQHSNQQKSANRSFKRGGA